jgi:large subunit ribosomal protein L35Ae
MPASNASQPLRLYSKATIVGYRRGGANSGNHYNRTSLLNIEGVRCREDTSFYLGKKVAFIYKAKVKKNGSNFRVVWGKVCRPHGTNGVVRCSFRRPLPPSSLGGAARVMLYPSRV